MDEVEETIERFELSEKEKAESNRSLNVSKIKENERIRSPYGYFE